MKRYWDLTNANLNVFLEKLFLFHLQVSNQTMFFRTTYIVDNFDFFLTTLVSNNCTQLLSAPLINLVQTIKLTGLELAWVPGTRVIFGQ